MPRRPCALRRTGSADRSISRQEVKIAGLNRSIVVGALAAVAAFVVYYTNALFTLALGVVIGKGLGESVGRSSPSLRSY